MTDEQPTATAPLYTATYATPPGYAKQLTRTYFAYSQTRPLNLALLVLIFLIAILLGVQLGSGLGVIGVAAAILIGLAIGMTVSYRRLGNRSQVIAPEGAVFSVTLRPNSIGLSSATASGENDYRAFQSIATRGDFVFLRHRAARINTILPAQLFTPEALGILRAKLSAL